MIIVPLSVALLFTGVIGHEAKELKLMSHTDRSFKAFQETCRVNFESMMEGPIIIISHKVDDRGPDKAFVSTYEYKIGTSDGGERGPYKFECRQFEDGKMTIYSEI